MQTFNCYMTDLFCGELNYGLVNRFKVNAKTKHGALCKIAKESGLNFRDYCNGEVYHSTSGLTGLVFDDDEFTEDEYENVTEI